MRVRSNAVVLSTLLLATVAVAGQSKKPAGSPAAPAAGSAQGSAQAPAAPAGSGSSSAAGSDAASTPVDLAAVKPEDMPTAVRMRRLEQKTQALKERAWQLKARVQMLKEQMLGGGVGAQAMIAHSNDMGASFRLVSLVYSLDGTQVFSRSDDSGDSLYKTRAFDIFSGPIAPGTHTIAAVATYRGHGYGVFEYLSKYTFTARGSNAFTAEEGKISKVDCKGYEKGGAATPMEKRPTIDCSVTEMAPEKPAAPPQSTTPGTTPMPAPAAATPATGSGN